MTINSKFIPAYYFQESFVDKDTGQLLAGGKIYFYRDSERTVLKPVYKVTGSPPNYSMVAMPNPIILSSVGTIQDSLGNDVVIYFYPYDEDGNQDLYYIQVYSSGDVLQFTREGEPNPNGINGLSSEIVNYVPNGQFLLHNNVLAYNMPSSPPGMLPYQVLPGATVLAPGGWTFETPSTSTSIDIVKFNRIGSYVPTPSASPRYSCQVICQGTGSNVQFKDLCLRFDDVNKFASDTQDYTFSFYAKCNSSLQFPISLSLFKYFGNGGSPSVTTSIGNVVITGSWAYFSANFVFGTNGSYTIGSDDDDLLKLQINFPTNSLFDIEFTDFSLVQGSVGITEFPPTTDNQFTYRSLAGSMSVPDPDGMDLYLPVVLTPYGLRTTTCDIAKIYATGTPYTQIGELFCDGTMYPTYEVSPDGIPYYRLWKKIIDYTSLLPLYGTGSEYITCWNSHAGTQISVAENSFGSFTHIADGAIPTGFTFSTIHEKSLNPSVGYGFSMYPISIYPSPQDHAITFADPVTAGTSGFTVTKPDSETYYDIQFIDSTTLGGKYFKIGVLHYVWYQVTGSEPDPGLFGLTGILVKLVSGDSVVDVMLKTCRAVFGYYCALISNIPSGLSIVAGSYFTFSCAVGDFYVWYTVDGSGADPSLSGKKGIRVDVLSSYAAHDVGYYTTLGMNSQYFAVPDLRGYFIRGVDPDGTVDPGDRFDFHTSTYLIGSQELSNNLKHYHASLNNYGGSVLFYTNSQGDINLATGGTTYVSDFLGSSGIDESRPVNKAFKWVIKY